MPAACRPAAHALAALCLAGGLAGCVVRIDSDGYKLREEKRFSTKGRTTVHLATFDGAIVVRGWDRDEVSVEVEKRGRDKDDVGGIEVAAEQKGDAVTVDVRLKGDAAKPGYTVGFLNSRSRSARLVASVPTGSNLIVRTGDGSIRVEHVNGKVELKSDDGSVTGFDLAGDVVAHTEDGAIKLEGLDGRCDVVSGDGSIAVHGRLEVLRVRTDDGSVVVKALAGSKVERDWTLNTRDGSMVLYVPDALGADVDAEAGEGSVRFDDSLTFARADGKRAKNVLRGRLGDGGLRLFMRSGDGSIRLRRLPDGMPMPPRPPQAPPPPDTPVER